jgi:hypothetical protein
VISDWKRENQLLSKKCDGYDGFLKRETEFYGVCHNGVPLRIWTLKMIIIDAISEDETMSNIESFKV